jgi:uncharacterized membrane protein
MNDRDAVRRWLLNVHVADWDRWQRTKRVCALLCWIIGIAAVGGTEWDPTTPDNANYGLALFALAAAAGFMWSVHHRER